MAILKPQINGKSPKTPKDNLLKTNRFLKPKYKLSGGLVYIYLASGVKSLLIPPVSYSMATNTLNIN